MALTDRIKNKTGPTKTNKNRDVVPTLVLVDNSGSMSDYVDEVNEAVKDFVNRLKSDPVTFNKIDLCIASFNNEYREILPFTRIPNISYIEKIKKPDKNPTLLGTAVSKAVNSLAAEKWKLKNNEIPYNQPILVILSDGIPQFEDKDDTNKGIADIQRKISNEKWCSLAFLAGDHPESSKELLEKFTSHGVLCQNNDNQLQNIVDMFKYASASVTVVAEDNQSNAGYSNVTLAPADDFLRKMELKKSQADHLIKVMNAANNSK